ncbi:chaperonin 10-like protein [Phaeosphaeriaceae sp. PMI808]|nr:chaperonin 10-like protein [Phaeosphaeriaceae sp. PMI808]
MSTFMSGYSKDLPDTQEALVQSHDGALLLRRREPIPQLSKGDVLVKVYAVGLNPADYKMPSYFTTPGAIGGYDFAGTVAILGPNTSSRFRVGDRVCGAVHGSNPLDHSSGSFATYVRVSVDLLVKVPQTLRWEEAAALGGVGRGTCALAIWECLGLGGTPSKPVEEPVPVLVYGGSKERASP